MKISESFKSFGVADDDKDVFVVLIDDEDDSRFSKICFLLGTSPSSVSELSEIADKDRITKVIIV